MRFPKVLPLLALAGALVACGKEATRAGGSGRTDIYTEPFKFGDAADANGIVTHEGDLIPEGSAAAMSFYVRNAPAGTQVRVVWKDVASKAEAGEPVKSIGSKGFGAFQQ